MRASLLAAVIGGVSFVTLVSGASRAAMETDALEDCAPIDDALRDRVRADVLRAYRPSGEGCSLEVSIVDCAPRAEISSLVFERGAGHSLGASLVVTKLDRDAQGAWSVTRLELLRGKGRLAAWQGEASDGVRVRRGVLSDFSAKGIDAAIERAQTLPAIHLEEKSADVWLRGAWFSSGNFHDALAFTAGATTYGFEHTGYESSLDQPAYLALDVVVDALDAATPEVALTDAPFDAAARALFVERFLADAPTFDESFHWWVREAWARAAADGGDGRLVPILAKYLVAASTTKDASAMRTRVQAINALASLSGDDRRFDASGRPRDVDVVAFDYLSSPPK